MSVWTNGEAHVLVGPRGLSIHRSDAVELILSEEQLGGALPAKKGKTGFARLRPLAVGPRLDTAFTIAKDRKLLRTALRVGGAASLFPWDISALAPFDGERVLAAYVTGTKARALTSIVLGSPPADEKASWEFHYEGPRPTKVDWPEDLLWDKAPWSRKTRWATDPDLLHIDANAHGYTVYDTASAVVGVLRRPGPQPPEGFACILRTPKDKGSTVAASATAKGVIVATCTPDSKAVISHFDDSGKLLAHRLLEASKIHPLSVAGDRVVALVEDRRVLVLGVEDLATQATLELAEPLAPQIELRASGDGASFLLASAEGVLRGEQTTGDWSLAALDLSAVPAAGQDHERSIELAEVEVAEEPTGADGKPLDLRTRIITQAPRLDLNPDQPNAAWAFTAASEFEIELRAVSVGGACETGLYAEISGEAVDKGLIEPLSVRVEGPDEGQADFAPGGRTRRAVIAEFAVPAGVEPIKDKKIKPKERFLENPEDTFLTIRIRGRALAPGSGLLFVRIGFGGAGQEGSLMRGRPVEVG